MNKEVQKLDSIMGGLIPYNFSTFTVTTYDRKKTEFTWSDLDFNLNTLPYQCDTAIIVTSWCGHLGWLKKTLTNYRKSGCFIILSFDSSMYIWENHPPVDYMVRRLPRPLHHMLAHTVVFKHKTYDADKRTGWYWDVKYAHSIISGYPNIKYVYCTNGDCLIEKPEGMHRLPEILADGDLMAGQSELGKTIHTATLYMKREAFDKIMNYIDNRMKYPVIGSQSPEGLLRDAVNELNLKETFIKYPMLPQGGVDYYATQNLDSTWKEVLGFRNIYGEFEYRENNGLEPLPKDFLDEYQNWIYFRDTWKETICKYYDTGDRRYLLQFWDRGKDSAEDRKFYPLEHYGKEPIYGTDKR